MAKTAQLYDGTRLEFPDGTSDDVIGKAAARETQRIRAEQDAAAPDAPGLSSTVAPVSPATDAGPAEPAAPADAPGLARRGTMRAVPPFVAQENRAGAGRGVVNPVAMGEPKRPDETVADFASRQPGSPDPAAWNTPDTMAALSVAPGERDRRVQATADAAARAKNVIKAVPEFGQGVASVARAIRGTQSRGSVADAARDFAADAVTGSAQGMAQFNQGVGGLERGIGEAAGLQKLAQFGEATARAAEDFQQVATNPRGNTLTEQAFGSLVNNVALLPFGRGTLPLMGLQQGGQSYNEARQAGFSPLEALDRGVWQGTAEIIGERFSVPLLQKTFSKYVGKVSNQELGHILADIAVKEQIGEQLTTAFQDAYDKAGIAGMRPNMTLAEYLTDAVNTAKVTLMQSVLMSAGAGAGHGVAKALAQRRPVTPYDEAADAGLNLTPPLTTDTPEQQLSKTIGVFKGVAAQYGMPAEAVQRAVAAAKEMPAADVPGFLSRLTQAMDKRGLVAAPVEPHAIAALAAGPVQPEPEMPDHEALTAPSADNPVKTAELAKTEAGGTESSAAGEKDGAELAKPADGGTKAAAGETNAAESGTAAAPRETTVAVGPSKLVRTASGWEVQNGAPVDVAAHEAATSPTNDLIEPTPAQAEAGNYRKGHARIAGLDVSIENPEGSVRRDLKNEPPKWQNEMKGAHYGYIRGTVGMDGDHVDAFIKPGTPEDHAGDVYVIDQLHADGTPDEAKVMMGYASQKEASAAYLAHYPKGWKGLGAITAAPVAEFKAWLKDGDTAQPFAAAVDKSAVLPGDKTADLQGKSDEPAQPDVQPTATVPADAAAGGRAQPAGGSRAVGPDAGAAARPARRQPAEPPVAGGKPAVAVPDAGGGAAAVGPRVIGRVGAMPNSAQPLEVRTNKDGTLTPWLEGHELLDFDSGDPVKVPAGATDEQVLAAIKTAGSLGKRQRVFAADKAEKKGTKPAKPEATRELNDAEAFADDYAAFAGRTLEQTVQIAGSEREATLKIDAAAALRDNDARRKALTDLLGCISRSA